MHYLFLHLLLLKSTIKKQSNSPHNDFPTHHWDLIRECSNVNITGHAQTAKNQLFLDLTESLQIFTKSWRKVSWSNPHQNFIYTSVPFHLKITENKKSTLLFLTQKSHFFWHEKSQKLGKNCTISFCNWILLKSTIKTQSNSPHIIFQLIIAS